MNKKDNTYIFYFQIVDVWNRLCTEHSTLFDYTCKEYSYLLENNLNDLEIVVAEKEATIKRISLLEQLRQKVVSTINESLSVKDRINSMSDLFHFMQTLEEEKTGKHLSRFNDILVDMIEKIQLQNKRNQMFITKANETLQEIRNGLAGNSNYCTYNARGSKTHKTNSIFIKPSVAKES